MNYQKTELMHSLSNLQQFKLHGYIIKAVNNLKYLGSVINRDGNVTDDVVHRFKVAWMRWRSVSGKV